VLARLPGPKKQGEELDVREGSSAEAGEAFARTIHGTNACRPRARPIDTGFRGLAPLC
jgi:hypothetical protein